MSVTQVQTSGITDDAVTNAKIANNAVTNAKIADSAVGTAEIANDAVTNAKIADSAVGTAEIANDAVTAPKLSGGQSGSAPVYGVRAYGRMFNGDGGTPGVGGGNLASAVREGNSSPYEYRINFTTPMPNASYAVCLTIGSDNDHVCQVTGRDTNFFRFKAYDPGQGNNERTNIDEVFIIVVG